MSARLEKSSFLIFTLFAVLLAVLLNSLSITIFDTDRGIPWTNQSIVHPDYIFGLFEPVEPSDQDHEVIYWYPLGGIMNTLLAISISIILHALFRRINTPPLLRSRIFQCRLSTLIVLGLTASLLLGFFLWVMGLANKYPIEQFASAAIAPPYGHGSVYWTLSPTVLHKYEAAVCIFSAALILAAIAIVTESRARQKERSRNAVHTPNAAA